MSSRLLTIGLALLALASARVSGASRDLLARGSEDHFWIARVMTVASPSPGVRTLFYQRRAGRDAFQQLSQIGARTVGLASRGAQLAALLEDGEWMLISEDGVSSGRPLPDSAPITALSNDASTLWAVGLVHPQTDPASAPATGPASAGRFVLYSLGDDGKWTARADLPPSVQPLAGEPRPEISLAVVDHAPCLAFRSPGSAPRMTRLTEGAWTEVPRPKLPARVSSFEFAGAIPPPALWLEAEEGPDSLWFLEPGGSRVVPLPPPANAAPKDRAVSLAMGRIRSLALTDKTILEQDYDPQTGAVTGASLPVALPQSSYPDYSYLIQIVVTAALVFTVVTSMRRRRMMRGMVFDLRKLRIAPMGRRLGAGVIDGLPMLAPLFFSARVQAAGNPVDPRLARTFEIISIAAMAAYVLHTALTEVLTGRSLGKLVFGLRVAGLDGRPAPKSALLMRNVLRVIDVGLLFLPLVVVFISPLRQRAADVAAGTLVVRDAEAEPKSD